MAKTHSARLDRLESRDQAILMFIENFQRERAEYRKTIERLTARIEKLEREAGTALPVVQWHKRERAGLS